MYMKKNVLLIVALSLSVSIHAGQCATIPEGVNIWRFLYGVGACLETQAELLNTKLDACCSTIEATLTALDLGALSNLDPILSRLEACDMCSNFDVLNSKIDVLNSALDVCSAIVTLSSTVDACCETLSTLDRLILSDVDSVSTKVDSVSSKIDLLDSKSDLCCSTLSVLETINKSSIDSVGSQVSQVKSVVDSISGKVDSVSVLEVINKTSIDSVGIQVAELGSRSDACCVSLSTLDRLILSDVDSVSTKVDSVSSKIDLLDSKSDLCCSTLSVLETINKSSIDSVGSQVSQVKSVVDSISGKVDSVSVLEVINKTSIDSVGIQVAELGSRSDACCVSLSTLDRLILSDVDSVSTKVDSVSSKIDLLDSKSDLCCSTLSVLETINKSSIDSVGSQVSRVKSVVDSISGKVDSVSVLEVINKTSIDSVGIQVAELGSRSDACCVSLSTLDRLILSDVDSVSTKVDSVSSKIDRCCSVIDQDVLSVGDVLSGELSACCSTLESIIDVLTNKTLILESILDTIANQAHGFVSCFGDALSVGRDEYISINFQYGFDGYNTRSTVANGGSLITTSSMMRLSTGTNVAGSSILESKRALRYRPGHEGYAFFTAGFLNGGAAQSRQWIGLFDANNGMAIGFQNIDFAVLFRQNAVDTVVTQANFNVDTLDGSGPSGIILDPTKINVFRISYGWLGVATISYQIFRVDCTWHTFHVIEWANEQVQPHLMNPVLPIRAEVVNTGNNTDLLLATVSWNAGILGDLSHVGQRAFSALTDPPVAVNTTERPILSIRNNTTFNGVINKIEGRIYGYGGGDFGSTSSRLILRLRLNPTTLTGSSFTPVSSGNSVMSFDTSATALTGGILQLVLPSISAASGPTIEYLGDTDIDVIILPGDTLTLTAQADAGALGVDVRGFLTWAELF